MEVLIGKLTVLMQVLIGTSASQINEHEGIINGLVGTICKKQLFVPSN